MYYTKQTKSNLLQLQNHNNSSLVKYWVIDIAEDKVFTFLILCDKC